MTREEMWKEFENQLIRETRTPITVSYDVSERMIKSAIEETVAKWKERLEHEPCDDAISRHAVLDCLTATELKKFDFIIQAREAINNLPPVTPQPKIGRWIPVSEGLPKRNGYYLVTGRQGAVNKRRYHDGHWYGNWSVLAWMPLPEPYKAESEDKE